MRSQGRLIVCVGLLASGLMVFPLRAQEDRGRVEAEARGQAAEADRRFKEGDYAGALPLYQAERASRAALGDQRYEAYAIRATGCCLAELGRHDEAIDAWTDARRIDSKREDPGFEGYDCLLIGNLELGRGRPRAAEKALREALPKLSQAVDRDHESDARRLLGRVLTVTGRATEAGPYFVRAWDLAAELNDARRLADVGADWGLTAIDLGAPGHAAELWDDARRAFAELGLAPAAALMDRKLGDALLDLGLPKAAAARVEEAARAHERLNDPRMLADDLGFLAELRAAAGDLKAAIGLAQRALEADRDADDPEGERDDLVTLAHYQGLSGAWRDSAATLADAVKLVRRDGEPVDQVRLLLLAATVEQRAGKSDRERALLDEAERTAREAKDKGLVEAVAQARKGATAPPR
jgi:tetratricopeptide (TPR) repeat protein